MYIEQGLTQWRAEGISKVKLYNLREQSSREDLYGCVNVTINGAGKGGGQRHQLALAQVVAPLLEDGESIRLCISKYGLDDCLEFLDES